MTVKTRQAKKIYKRLLQQQSERQMPTYQSSSWSKALKVLKRKKANKNFFSQSAISFEEEVLKLKTSYNSIQKAKRNAEDDVQ